MSGGYRPFDGDAWLGRELPLRGGPYRVLPESAFDVAEEMAFARQGRKARVYKVLGPDGTPYALKAFYRGFSLPQYVAITGSLRTFGDIPGLRTCQRRLVDEDEAAAIGEPGLAYAVLMPWIEAVAWAGVVEHRFPLPDDVCVALATQTATLLATMEARGLVHADISSTNVLITASVGGPAVELIDVEDMYHDSFGSLPYVPDGSPGYAHPGNRGRGCRNRYGDRFAAAILLTELLVWHDQVIRESAGDISVFDQGELGRDGSKHDRVRELLRRRSTQIAALFDRAWGSPGPSECPRLAEWGEAVATMRDDSRRPKKNQDESVGTPNPPRPDAATASCPGCGKPVHPRHADVDHASACPLRPAAEDLGAPAAGQSSFPGVPRYDDIGFVPLFDDNA